jgi:RHS repeat-associated protein
LTLPGGTINQTTQFCDDRSSSGHGATGNIVSKWEWKFYTGAVLPDPTIGSNSCTLTATTPPDRTTTYTYQNASGYIAKNIVNRVASTTVTDKNASTVAKTVNTYDGSSLTSIGGIANHDDTNYGTGDTIRGNLTQQQRLVAGSTYVTTSATYDTTGQRITSTDGNGNPTSYLYTDNFFNDAGDTTSPTAYTPPAPTNALLTSVAAGGLTNSFGYYWGTGQSASSTDPNSQTTYEHFYDSMNRPTSTKMPDGGWTFTQYTNARQVDMGRGITSTTLTTNCPASSSACRHDQTLLDTMGRAISSIVVSDPDGVDTKATTYDANARLLSVSNPYRSPSDPTYGWTTSTYDGLDRVIQTTRQDSSLLKKYYGAQVSTGGGASSQLCSSSFGLGYPILTIDEASNKRQTWTDGLGRVIEADEPDSTGNLTVATCYAYDLNSNLIGVLSAGGTQLTCTINGVQYTRCFTYDLLSGLISSTNPESGTMQYTYDANGNVQTKTAPSPNQGATGTATVTTTYTYDVLNRITGKSYHDNYVQNPSTPSVKYGYEGVTLSGCATAPPGLTDSYPKGRRTSMCDGSGGTSWSHEQVGRIKQERRAIGAVQGDYETDTYNLDGSVATLTALGYKVTYTYSGAGRVITAKNGADPFNYVTSASYAPFGALAGMSMGASPITVSDSYSSRLQPVVLSASTTAATIVSLSYDFHSAAHADNGNIFQIVNNRDNNRTQNFVYDSLNRIKQAYTNGSNWGEQYTIDTYGNLTNIARYSGKSNSESLNCAPANTRDQLSTCFGYDAAGNLTSNGSTAYSYDGENHLIGTSGMSYIYDGDGKRVEKCNAGSTPGTCATNATGTLYWSAPPNNDPAVETDLTNNVLETYVFFNGRRIARREPGTPPTYHFYFSDHLGSHNVITNASGSSCEQDIDYYPYGGVEQDYCGTVAQHYKFTGKERDSESNLDNFGARYYGSFMDRFMTPDDGSDQDAADPQSWNLYGYVRNDPLSNTDPTGNYCVRDEGPNGLGPWHDDNRGGETCAQVDAANKKALEGGSDDDLNWRARVVFGNPIFGQASKTVNVLGGTLVVGGAVAGGVIAAGAIAGTSLITLGTLTAQGSNLAPLVLPLGAKVAQMIARTGVGRGDPSQLLAYLEGLRNAAVEGGTYVQNVNYIAPGSTIYRVGSTFMTVAKDGVVRSIVPQAQAGVGVVKAYFDAGGH